MPRLVPLFRLLPWFPMMVLLVNLPVSATNHNASSWHNPAAPSILSSTAVNGQNSTVHENVSNLGFNAAFDSIWETLKPYLTPETPKDIAGVHLTTFRRRLLNEAKDMILQFSTRRDVIPQDGLNEEPREVPGYERCANTQSDEEPEYLHRVKREHPRDVPLIRETNGIPVVSDIQELASLDLESSNRMKMVVWKNRIVIAAMDNNNQTLIYTLDEHLLKARYETRTLGYHMCEFAVVSGDRLLLSCIMPYLSFKNGNVHIRAKDVKIHEIKEGSTPEKFLTLQQVQEISSESPSDVKIWVQRKSCYLMITSSEELNEATETGISKSGQLTYHTDSKIYEWTGEYFDVVQELPGAHPKAVSHFMVDNLHFIALANFANNKGEHNINSIIYKYSLDVGRYVVFQEIFTYGAYDFEAFTVGSGIASHTFLAVANYCEDNELGKCQPYTKSKIYRYHFGKFLLFQEIQTVNAVQWLAVQTGDSVLLAVANVLSGVTFYQYNGWRFALATIQYHSGLFGMGVSSISAAVWNNTVIIGVSNKDPERFRQKNPSIYEIHFKIEKSVQEYHSASERWCNHRLKQLQTFQLSVLHEEAIKSPKTTDSYRFLNHITMENGLVVSSSSNVSQIYDKLKDQWIPQHFPDLQSRNSVLRRMLRSGKENLNNTIPIHELVVWPDYLQFEIIVASETSGIPFIDDLRADLINNQLVSEELMLRLDSNDRFNSTNLSFATIELQAPMFAKSLMGYPGDSFVTLSGDHVVSGDATVIEDVKSSEVSSPLVDDIGVHSDRLFLSRDVQTHRGEIKCTSVNVGGLDADRINGINVSEVFPGIVTHTGNYAINGIMNILSDLHHNGNLESRVTGLDSLFPLRTDDLSEQLVTGMHIASNVQGEFLNVRGSINSIEIPREVFLNHSEASYRVLEATFQELEASAITAYHNMDSIMVHSGKLAALDLHLDTEVTAIKSFTDLTLLYVDTIKDKIRSNRKRRHAEEQECGIPGASEWKTEETDLQLLIWAVKSLALAENFLKYFESLKYFEKFHVEYIAPTSYIDQDKFEFNIHCAFSDIIGNRVHANNVTKFEEKQVGRISLKRIKLIIDNIVEYKTYIENLLSDMQFYWDGNNVTYMYLTDNYFKDFDIEIGKIKVRKVKPLTGISCHDFCEALSPEKMTQNRMDYGPRQIKTTAIFYFLCLMERLKSYPSIIGNIMTWLTPDQQQLVEMAIVANDVRGYLETTRMNFSMETALNIATSCSGVCIGSTYEGLWSMLPGHGESSKTSRIKRDVIIIGDEKLKSTADIDEAAEQVCTGSLSAIQNEDEHESETRLITLRKIEQYLGTIKSSKPWSLVPVNTTDHGSVRSIKINTNVTFYLTTLFDNVNNPLRNLTVENLLALESLNAFDNDLNATRFAEFMTFIRMSKFGIPLKVVEAFKNFSGLVSDRFEMVTKAMDCIHKNMTDSPRIIKDHDVTDFNLPMTTLHTISSTPPSSPATALTLTTKAAIATRSLSSDIPSLLNRIEDEDELKVVDNLIDETLDLVKQIVNANPWNSVTAQKLSKQKLSTGNESLIDTVDDIHNFLKFVTKDPLRYIVNAEIKELKALVDRYTAAMSEVKYSVDKSQIILQAIYGTNRPYNAVSAEIVLLKIKRVLSRTITIANKSASEELADGLELHNGSRVDGLVVGYNLSHLLQASSVKMLNSRKSLEYIESNVERFQNIAFSSELLLPKTNVPELKYLQEHGILLNSETIGTKFIFANNVKVEGNVQASYVNNHSSNAYATLSGRPVFPSPVNFSDKMKGHGNVRVKTVNNLKIRNFSLAAAKLSGQRVFTNSVYFSSIVVDSFESGEVNISGVSLQDAVQLDGVLEVTGDKTFTRLEVKNESVFATDVTTNFISGVNIKDMYDNTLRKFTDKDQLMFGHQEVRQLHLQNRLHTRGFIITAEGKNPTLHLSLPKFDDQVLYRNKKNRINGSLILSARTTVTNLDFKKNFDSVPSSDYTEGWLLNNSEQRIEGQIVVKSMKSTIVTASPHVKFQGVDLYRLNDKTAKMDEASFITSQLNLGEVYSTISVSVDGLVQGWDLSVEGITKTSNVNFNSTKTFVQSVSLSNSFNVVRFVNDVDVGNSCYDGSFNDLHVAGIVEIERDISVGRASLADTEIAQNSIENFWRRDQNITLRHPMRIQEVSADNVGISDKSPVDLRNIEGRILRNVCDQIQNVSERYKVHSLDVLAINTSEVTTGALNGQRFADLDILRKEGEQTVSGHLITTSIQITGSITTAGFINGVPISSLCQLLEPCLITARKTFTKELQIKNENAIEIHRTVQGVDISEAFKLDVSKSQCGKIPGITVFKEPPNFRGLRVHGLVDGVEMSVDGVLTNSGDQVINPEMIISNPQGSAVSALEMNTGDGLFAYRNLSGLLGRSVQHGKELTVNAPVDFDKVDMDTLDDVVAIDLPHFYVDTATTLPTYDAAIEALANISNAIFLNSRAVKDQVYKFWGWKELQKFDVALERIIPFIMISSANREESESQDCKYLGLLSKLEDARVMVFNSTYNTYEYPDDRLDLIGDCPKRVVGFSSQGSEFIVTGHACSYDHPSFPTVDSTTEALEGDESVLIWEVINHGTHLLSTINTPGAADIQVIELKSRVCLLVVEARGTDTVVHCEDRPHHFIEHQRITTGNPRKASIIQHKNLAGQTFTILAVADQGDFPHTKGSFSIWRYDDERDQFITLQVVDFDNVVWVEMASQNGDLYLVAVSEAFRGDQKGKGEIEVYRMEGLNEKEPPQFDGVKTLPHIGYKAESRGGVANPGFYWIQELGIEQPSEAKFATHQDDELNLYVINKNGVVSRFSQKGIQRFWKEGELHTHGKQTLEAWACNAGKGLVHRLSLAGQTCSDLEPTFPEEPDVVLEASFRGWRP